MKKISTELTKNYLTIIILIITIFSFLAFLVSKHQYSYSRQGIYGSLSFLKYELEEPDHAVISKSDVKNFLIELPDIEDLDVFVYYQGTFFNKNNSSKPYFLDTLPKNEKIKLYKKKYWFLHKTLYTQSGEEFDVFLVKNLDSLFSFFKQIFFIFGLSLIFLVFLCIFFMKRFYKKFIPQLELIQNKTDSLNLDSLDFKLENTDFYYEFSNILSSYKKMVLRIKEQSEMQTDFVNNASHELKTPIFIIKSYSSLIKKYHLTDRKLLLESVDYLTNEVNHMEKLIEKLLFLSRISFQKIKLEKIPISDVIIDVIQEIKIFNPEQEINFNETNCTINSNWTLCKQIIRNLLDNAVKYGCNKPIDVKVTIHDTYIIISIKDQGIGIPNSELDLIFNKFYRVGSSRSCDGKGYGLGLSIVKTIVLILGGNINISSTVGMGTIISINLPK